MIQSASAAGTIPSEWLIVLSTLSAAASLLGTAAALGLRRLGEGRKLRASDEVRFHRVIESNRLEEVGEYLDQVVGRFAIAEYADNPVVRHRVDTYLARIQRFVGTTEAIDEQVQEERSPTSTPVLIANLDEEFATAIQEVRGGMTWNGLARMRRHLERKLVAGAQKRGIPVDQWAPAGMLIGLLIQAGVLSKIDEPELRSALLLANRAIHGEEVTADDAIAAIQHVAHAVREVDGIRAAERRTRKFRIEND